MYRQGDILMIKAEEYKGDKLDSTIIQEGEATGHAHRIADPATAELFGVRGVAEFIVVNTAADIVHEDHNTITLDEGIYRIVRQREYSPRENRRVLD